MATVPITEIAKIPYIDHQHLYGREISSLTFFVNGEWQLWISAGERIIPLKAAGLSEGFYFAKEPESQADVYLNFLNFIAQHACWPSARKPLDGLMQDFFNLAACLKKFEILFDYSGTLKTDTSRLVITEIEYIFGLCRSIFDLLQEMIAAQWQAVKLLDASAKKRQLRKKFSDMIIINDRIRTQAELMKLFYIPQQLADFYVRNGPFFQILKNFRDRFFHGGQTIKILYITERGFAVPASTAPFCDFGVWNQDHRLPNDLCSLRPAIAHIINETLKACEDYALTVQSIIEYPSPIVPDFRFFMRSSFTKYLIDNKKVLEECLWWKDI